MINIDEISSIPERIKKYKPLPRFPSISYDISVLVDKRKKAENVLKILKNIDSLIEKTEIIEVFEGKGVEDGKKSITLSFKFRANDRTLTDEEAKKIEAKIIDKLEKNGIKKRF